ncbi:MAG: hypothetical protein ABIH00_11480 [Armatimonadota bacterium]
MINNDPVRQDPLKQTQAQMRWYGYIALLIFMVILAIPYFTKKIHFGLLDYVNLPFHEAGHFVFGIFGEFIGALGGTLGQLIFPVGFSIYFLLFRRDYAAGIFSLFWVSENLINISIYMADAQTQSLSLFGGNVHDWAYLCAEMKLITKIPAIAKFVRFLGSAGMIGSIFALIYIIITRSPFRFSIKK